MPSDKLNGTHAKNQTHMFNMIRPGVRGSITTYDNIEVELLDVLCQADADQFRISDRVGCNRMKKRMAVTHLFTSVFMMMSSDKLQSTKRAKCNYGNQRFRKVRPASERANACLGVQKYGETAWPDFLTR